MSRADLARPVADARRLVVFTGAGISAEQPAPILGSPGGVWSRMKPIYFQDFVSDPARRREAWERAFSGRAGWTGREPNAGHLAVARLVAQGKATAVITQNVDDLHQKSGIPPERVIELHGNASYAACLDCAERHELAELQGELPEGRRYPLLPPLRRWWKTATISFGEAMAGGSPWLGPRPRPRWPAIRSWCWVRLWSSTRRRGSR